VSSVRLVYFEGAIIKEYCALHPIDWASQELANGPGNLLTPSPALEVFFETLTDSARLFDQAEYWEAASTKWVDWLNTLTDEQKLGVKARMYRNFYPSAIDSLHAWSLLVESGKFAYCMLDTAQDAVSKRDITVCTKDRLSVGIALSIATKESHKWMRHKRQCRGRASGIVVPILLSMDKPRKPGNKRWYSIDDFKPLWITLEELRSESQQAAD